MQKLAMGLVLVSSGIDESAGWLMSLPQLVFSLLLCGAVAGLAGDRGGRRRLQGLRWVFVALCLAPALVYGGGLDPLEVPLAVLTVSANVYLVYLLFAMGNRPLATPGAA